jgi:DNA-binding NarL/FixJ family response regulator
MPNSKQITVVIAEDQAIIREGLVLVCQSRDLQVVAQCADGLTALETIRSLKPDFALLKDGPPSHLTDAINYVRDGGVYVSPLLRVAGLLPSTREAREDDPLTHLSRREHDVFFHLVNGLRAKEIANLLDISPKTVDTYRASLMRKLNIHDLVGLVKFAIEHKLTTT